MRAAAGAVLGLVPPARLLGGTFGRAFRFVQDAETWPAERSRAYQLEQLQALCTLAAGTPFYENAFAASGFRPGDLKAPEDLAALPTIDRGTLSAHLEEMRTAAKDAPGVDLVSTGGTSGEPLRFYIGASRSATEYAYILSGWKRAGYTLGAPLAVFRGRVVAPDGQGLRHEYDPLLRHHFYSNFHMGPADMTAYLAHVATLGPCYLHVYPSSAFALARHIRHAGVPVPPNVKGILAESEIVYPEQRELVEATFGCRYLSGYGHTEKLAAAAECEKSSDYHVFPTYGYVELLDAAGQRITTVGQRGEIVATGFINRIVPFIRYRTGDFATYGGEGCSSCGREQTLLREIRGHRVQESLVAGDGSLVSWTALNMHDDTFFGLLRYQFYQEQPGRAVLRVVPAGAFSEADRRRILERLGAKLSGRVDFTVEPVEAIALSKAGKAIYVDQRIAGH